MEVERGHTRRVPAVGKVIDFETARQRHGRASAGRLACIAASTSSVIPFTPRAAVRSRICGHHLPGIFPRSRQLLTSGAFTPNASATTEVPPRSSMSESAVIMNPSIFTFCEGVNSHISAMARANSAAHAFLMAKPYAQIGKRLAALRDALGISQAELCRQIRCEPNRWNQYESGERRITIPISMRVADAYGASMDWVYRGETRTLTQDLFAKIVRAA